MDSCRSGAVGEMMTACELLKRSWVVSFPQTSAPFDLVATDAKGRSVLIQIKASDTPRNESPNRTPRYCWNTSRRKGEYAQTDFDFWILLAMSHLCWVLSRTMLSYRRYQVGCHPTQGACLKNGATALNCLKKCDQTCDAFSNLLIS